MVPVQGVILDVNETLFSLDALQQVFGDVGLQDQRELWFARTLRTGFALTCMGEYRSFPEVARETFKVMAPDRVGNAEQDALIEAFARLHPHPDVAPALAMVHEARLPVATLSVGNAANVERLFDGAGLGGLVDIHLSCETVQRWKPAPEPYLYACEVLGVDPTNAWLVAAHSWDIGGAAAVGMRTAWLSRLEGHFDESFAAPDVVGVDLIEVVERVVAGV